MVARSRLIIDQGSGDVNPTSSSNLSGPSSSSEVLDDLESGTLPPSPFSGRKSWGIDFKGFGNRDDYGSKKSNESSSTALDPIIRVVAESYDFLSTGKYDGWIGRAAKMCILLTLLLVVLWIVIGVWSEK